MRIRPFTDTLRDLRSGKTLDDLTHQLAALVVAVEDTQRPGEIKLTLKIKPSAKGPWVHIEDKVDVKMPEPDREATLFWPVDGELRRQDPRQATFDLKANNRRPDDDDDAKEETACRRRSTSTSSSLPSGSGGMSRSRCSTGRRPMVSGW